MVRYKLSKNDWVTPFFVIFRSVREKLLVTVFFEHPVLEYCIDNIVNSQILEYSMIVKNLPPPKMRNVKARL